MRLKRVAHILSYGVIGSGLGIVFFSDYLFSSYAPKWTWTATFQVRAVYVDPQTQWLLALCLVLYFCVFVYLGKLLAGYGRWLRWNNPDVWLTGLVAIAVARYVADISNGSYPTQPLGLLAGIVLGQGASVWVRWRGDPRVALRRTRWLLTVLVFSLAAIALWQPRFGSPYKYRGQVRWNGIWDSPNTYGALMGLGVLLGLGLLLLCSRASDVSPKEPGTEQRPAHRLRGLFAWLKRVWPWIQEWFLVVAVGVCGLGLVRSYSRGAWLATACGLVALLWVWVRTGAAQSRIRQWLQHNGIVLLVILLSVLAIVFWQYRDTEWRPLRRLLSIGNPNDFSWRNRLTTWEGALQMMADKPWFGFGWEKSVQVYSGLYAPPRLEESGAFSLNDYLKVGASAGIPAFLLLFGAIWIRLRYSFGAIVRACEVGGSIEFVRSCLLSGICGVGALALAVGFWFNGGLLAFDRAPLFWGLIMLASLQSGVRDATLKSNFKIGWVEICALITFVMALCWAAARDPFRRIKFVVQDETRGRTTCMAVMPKRGGPFPVVVYAYGGGGSLEKSAPTLRMIAELGLAAVSFDYNKTNQVHFDAQMRALLAALSGFRWAHADAVAWIGHSLGAQCMLSFLVTHPHLHPRALVLLAGGGVSNQDSLSTNGCDLGWSTHVWIVHGELDNVFPVSEAHRVARLLR